MIATEPKPGERYRGNFWEVNGVVKYEGELSIAEGDRIELLIIDIPNDARSFHLPYKPANIWHGIISDGTQLTLFYPDCRSFGSGGEIVFECRSLLAGLHLNRLEQDIILSLHGECPLIRNWLDVSGLKFKMGKEIGRYTISHRPLRHRTLCSNDDFMVEIYSSYNVPFGADATGSVKLSEKVCIGIHFRKPTTIWRSVKTLKAILALFSFLVGQKITCNGLAFRGAGEEDVYFPVGDLAEHVVGEASHNLRQPIIRYTEVKKRIDPLVNRWLNLVNELTYLDEIYGKVAYGGAGSLDIKFLLVTQAIDIFLDKYISENDINRRQVAKVRSFITKEVHHALRSRMRERLQWLQRRALRERVAELCDKFELVFSHHKINIHEFSKKYSKLRNEMAHRRSGVGGFESRDQFVVFKISRMLFELCIFYELGWRTQKHLLHLAQIVPYWQGVGDEKRIQYLGYERDDPI